jgi:hypothetical protein
LLGEVQIIGGNFESSSSTNPNVACGVRVGTLARCAGMLAQRKVPALNECAGVATGRTRAGASVGRLGVHSRKKIVEHGGMSAGHNWCLAVVLATSHLLLALPVRITAAAAWHHPPSRLHGAAADWARRREREGRKVFAEGNDTAAGGQNNFFMLLCVLQYRFSSIVAVAPSRNYTHADSVGPATWKLSSWCPKHSW